ncbi:fumarylacetoacetate hydrolase [Pseudomonas syringae]|uniref:Fumarylacetoacetate hydrolase n=1 Tax=Pseudomonas syringae TaxID=317 RepID=A0A1C7Z239_PSESX|nr:fumarylacetoacetate hydrolase family protein [Pseudomonas syringae]OCR23479.1 fumarylacetoacetate hydrolase [Pseudomonas syringae]
MSEFVIAPVETPSLAVEGTTSRFPIRRVFCVGRNYSEHAREMGHDPDREPPFFFMKPADAVVAAEGSIAYPPLTRDLHHEVELVVAIGKDGVDIAPQDALDHVWGYAVGLDLTRRDLQGVAKKAGRPWEWGKAFDQSAPATPLVPASRIGHPDKGLIWLDVNGAERQRGDLADQIWSVKDVIAYISQSVALKAGDLIYTGTPAGVAALQPGDVLTGGVEGIGQFSLTVAAR